MFSGFDSRHTQKESAKSSFLIFSHLTFQGASAGLIFFTKSISSLQGPLYQMSQSIIVSVSCSQSKYSSWQLGRGLEEWEEGQNVKCGGTNTMKRFVCRWMVHGSFFCGFVPWALSKAQHKACQRLHSSISQGESLRHPSFTLRQSRRSRSPFPSPASPCLYTSLPCHPTARKQTVWILWPLGENWPVPSGRGPGFNISDSSSRPTHMKKQETSAGCISCFSVVKATWSVHRLLPTTVS